MVHMSSAGGLECACCVWGSSASLLGCSSWMGEERVSGMAQERVMKGFEGAQALGAEWLNVAARVPRTQAEGPGERFALWVQGCPLRCEGCCNPHMLEDREVSLERVEAVAEEIIGTRGIEGVTFIGGEPFWQAAALARVAQRVRERGLSVMVFSGLTLGYMRRQQREDFEAFLGQIDLLVDGPYIKRYHVTDRRWIGSSNQRVHFLTERYAHLSEELGRGWDRGPNTIELRLSGGQLTINGFPDESIVELSRASIRPVRRARGLDEE